MAELDKTKLDATTSNAPGLDKNDGGTEGHIRGVQRREGGLHGTAGGRWVLVVALLAFGGCVGVGFASWLGGWQLGADTAVYRAGALNLVHGGPLYGPDKLAFLPDWVLLPFIYPPAAALLFVPLGAVPAGVGWGLVLAASVFALFVALRAVLAHEPPSAWTTTGAVIGLTAVALVVEPVWKTLFLGQVNVLLMALVLADVLLLAGRRWTGVLTGMAAAIKLTPLIFVVHLFVVGRRMDAARALGTFVVLQALMFIVLPSQTGRYWLGLGDLELVDTGDWIFNQSLNGMLLRLLDGASWAENLALVIGAALAIPALWLVRRFTVRGDPAAAVLVTGFLALLASPLSWTHHWVWSVPLIVLLAARGHRLAAGAVFLLFASCVVMIVPNGGGLEFDWGPVEVVFGNSYVLFPLVAGAVLCARALRPPARARAHQATG